MTDGLKASQIKGGIRPSKSFDQGRVCKDESCSTQLSIYNKRDHCFNCLLYTSPSPRDQRGSRMPSSA